MTLVAYSTPREAWSPWPWSRTGHPKNIRTWDDLINPGVEVIEPNPFTSGGAEWKTPEQANAYLLELFRHVPVQDKSAREALQTFIGGRAT